MTASPDSTRIAELEQDNRRLRQLLDERGASGELRHRLRNTLAMLREIVRRSAETKRDLPDYVAHLQDRLDAVARAQALADRDGEVSLRTLLADELFQYGAFENERLALSGPEVWLQPKAGQVLALAFHELAINAVEHGTLGVDAGRVDVSWSVAEGDVVALLWTETGVASASGLPRGGFGTEVLTRMLAYELKAETAFSYANGGLRYSLRFALSDWVGRVDAA